MKMKRVMTAATMPTVQTTLVATHANVEWGTLALGLIAVSERC